MSRERHVVADRVAQDLAVGRDEHRELRLGHGDGGVRADPDGLTAGDGTPGRGLEEELGPLGVVDPRVDVLGRGGLLDPGVHRALVGHPGGPHLGAAVDRRQQQDVGERAGLGHERSLDQAPDLGQRTPEQLGEARDVRERQHVAVVEDADALAPRGALGVADQVHGNGPSVTGCSMGSRRPRRGRRRRARRAAADGCGRPARPAPRRGSRTGAAGRAAGPARASGGPRRSAGPG